MSSFSVEASLRPSIFNPFSAAVFSPLLRRRSLVKALISDFRRLPASLLELLGGFHFRRCFFLGIPERTNVCGSSRRRDKSRLQERVASDLVFYSPVKNAFVVGCIG